MDDELKINNQIESGSKNFNYYWKKLGNLNLFSQVFALKKEDVDNGTLISGIIIVVTFF